MLETLGHGRLPALALARRPIEVERLAEDQQHAGHAVVQVQLDPRRQLLAQARGAHAERADPAARARGLQLRRAELVDALAVDRLVVAPDLQQPRADRAAQEVVRAERVEAHVPAR